MTGLPVPVGTLNLIRAVLGIHHHRFDLFVKCSKLLLNLLERRLELLEILAFLAIGDLLGGTFVRSRTDVPEFRDVGRRGVLHPKLGQKLVIVDLLDPDRDRLCPCEKPLMVEGFKHGATIV